MFVLELRRTRWKDNTSIKINLKEKLYKGMDWTGFVWLKLVSGELSVNMV